MHPLLYQCGNINSLAVLGNVIFAKRKKVCIVKDNMVMLLHRFGHTEELVCAGSQTGALKIWDLEAARLVRTHTGKNLNGHNSVSDPLFL